MRYVISGRLRPGDVLSPAEYFTLAVREWEVVLGWIARGRALAYGRLGGPEGGAILVEAESLGEAQALARSLPFSPYAEVTVAPADPEAIGRGVAALLRAGAPARVSGAP